MLDVRSGDSLSSGEVDGLAEADLSPWFNPFLPLFVREARRSGGEVRLFRKGGAVVGLVLTDPVEHVATAFCRSRSLAEVLVRERGPLGMYCDFVFDPSAERFGIFALSAGTELPAHRFRHRVRPIAREDLPAVLDLMREVYGTVNERWFEELPEDSEAGFCVEVGGRVAGVGWVSKVGVHARLHSLTVRPPFRRMGMGTDLLFARLFWARPSGAVEVLSEISDQNVASQAIATRGGMRRVGEIYLHRPL